MCYTRGSHTQKKSNMASTVSDNNKIEMVHYAINNNITMIEVSKL